MVDASKSSKRVALASSIVLPLEERGNEVGGVWDQRRRMLEDGSDGEHGILSHIGMAMFEARPGRGEDRFDQLGFS